MKRKNWKWNNPQTGKRPRFTSTPVPTSASSGKNISERIILGYLDLSKFAALNPGQIKDMQFADRQEKRGFTLANVGRTNKKAAPEWDDLLLWVILPTQFSCYSASRTQRTEMSRHRHHFLAKGQRKAGQSVGREIMPARKPL